MAPSLWRREFNTANNGEKKGKLWNNRRESLEESLEQLRSEVTMERTTKFEKGETVVPTALDLLLERISTLETQNSSLQNEIEELKEKAGRVKELEDKVEQLELERKELLEKKKDEQPQALLRQLPESKPDSLKSLQTSHIHSSKGRKRDSVIFDGFRASFGMPQHVTSAQSGKRSKKVRPLSKSIETSSSDPGLTSFFMQDGHEPLSFPLRKSNDEENSSSSSSSSTRIEGDECDDNFGRSCQSAPLFFSWKDSHKIERIAEVPPEEGASESELDKFIERQFSKGARGTFGVADEKKNAEKITEKKDEDRMLSEDRKNQRGTNNTVIGKRKCINEALNGYVGDEIESNAEVNTVLSSPNESNNLMQQMGEDDENDCTLNESTGPQHQQLHEQNEQPYAAEIDELPPTFKVRKETGVFNTKTKRGRRKEPPDGDRCLTPMGNQAHQNAHPDSTEVPDIQTTEKFHRCGSQDSLLYGSAEETNHQSKESTSNKPDQSSQIPDELALERYASVGSHQSDGRRDHFRQTKSYRRLSSLEGENQLYHRSSSHDGGLPPKKNISFALGKRKTNRYHRPNSIMLANNQMAPIQAVKPKPLLSIEDLQDLDISDKPESLLETTAPDAFSALKDSEAVDGKNLTHDKGSLQLECDKIMAAPEIEAGMATAEKMNALNVSVVDEAEKSTDSKDGDMPTFKNFFLFSVDCSKYAANQTRPPSFSFPKSSPSSHTPQQQAVLPDSSLTGRRFLDPFILDTSCVDQYPQISTKKSDTLDPDVISTFCCPDGIQVRLIPRVAHGNSTAKEDCEKGRASDVGYRGGAARLGWIGNRGDRYKLLVFTDGNGSNIHGVAITVLEELLVENDVTNSEFVLLLTQQREKRSAIRKIQRWWKNLMERRHLSPKHLKRGSSSFDFGNAFNSFFRSKSDKKSKISISNRSLTSEEPIPVRRESNNSFHRTSTIKDDQASGMRRIKSLSAMPAYDVEDLCLSNNNSDEETDSSYNDSISGEFLDWDGLSHRRNSYKNSNASNSFPNVDTSKAYLSSFARERARESFQTMQAAVERGDTCIVEKCYVLIGGKPSDQFLQLHLLQGLVTEELTLKEGAVNFPFTKNYDESTGRRHRQTVAGKLAEKWRHLLKSHTEDCEKMLTCNRRISLQSFRHEYLRVLREEMRLTPEQTRIQLKHSMDFPSNQKSFRIEVPSLSSEASTICLPLPLPQVSGHWGVAALAHRIHPMDLLLILKLLLIERSVLVIGESTHLVTACTCAILHLLKPFEWASTFMPLLPDSMLDFVSSPVPYLIGMVVKDQKSINFEQDERIAEAMQIGLSVVNLTSRSVALTTEPQIAPLLRGCPTPLPELTVLSKNLETLRKTNPALRSFSRFLRDGLQNVEINAIDSFCILINCFLTGLADNIASEPNGWRYYGEFDEDGAEFDFYPFLFVDRLRNQMQSLECRVQFQEMMVYSQLFVEFVDVRRKLALSREEAGKYIANWVNFHWKLKQKAKKLRTKCTSSALNIVSI